MHKTLSLLVVSMLLFFHPVSAQYADRGSGVLKNFIWWFDWSGFTPQNGSSKTFNTADGLTVTITFSNVTGATALPNVMNTWSGAVLHFLYDFTDPAIQPALHARNTSSDTHFTLNITASRNGVPTPFTFVTADAEGSNLQEQTTVVSTGSPWTILELFRNSGQTSNPVTGCGTTTAMWTETYGGSSGIGQNPVLATEAPANGALQVDVTFAKTSQGGMAIAFGIFAPLDAGDLPASYGSASHKLSFVSGNGCNYLPPLPTISQTQTLKMGALPGDADPATNTDDNAVGADEDGVSVFPDYDGSGTYSISVGVSNTTGSDAFLSGWFDHNMDGVFNAGEAATAVVANNAASATLSWTGIPAFLPQGIVRDLAFRLRLSSDQAAVQSPAGMAIDGEVEDYLVPCSPVLINTIADQHICTGRSVQLNASGAAAYSWSPANGLSDPAAASPLASPLVNTRYTVTGRSTQGCTDTASVQVDVSPLPVFTHAPLNTAICKNDSVLLTAAGADTYSWLSETDVLLATTSSLLVKPDVSTTYKVRFTDHTCNVTDLQLVRVLVNPLPVTTVSRSNDLDCGNGQAQLNAAGGINYAWEPADGIRDASSSNQLVTPTQTTTYYVIITDINGCRKRDSVTVNVNYSGGQSLRLMPTAFTPNNDGKNDCFGLKYWGVVTQLDFSVYNRWGAMVFHTSNPYDCWDGKYLGQPQPAGTFVYQIKVASPCGDVYRKGTVTLIR